MRIYLENKLSLASGSKFISHAHQTHKKVCFEYFTGPKLKPFVIIHIKATVMCLGMALIYDHDYCLHATCAENADCSEIQFGHKCSCNRGYKGDGINFCNDIDECSLANRKWA